MRKKFVDKGANNEQMAELLEQLICNILDDSRNISILAQLCSVSTVNHQQKCSQSHRARDQPRDISKNEIIRPRDLPQVTGLSRTNIWRLERAGLFVKKIRLSAGACGYRRADVERWLEERQKVEE
ncbi:helix-turn-helix transcriptional regulator [Geobacter sulfurreducens]|uniref:helix-turn-helix transcriptional regulator n=1 Tax=Geobacter sulfurreducens TaxID=35554 RepID=UPI002573B467|nr:AlpA family phage regulatory protein [Geobacter sulfurreducens]